MRKPPPDKPTKPPTPKSHAPRATDMLTDAEIESLRRDAREAAAIADAMLTPSGIERLRRKEREYSAYASKAFARLRPKTKG